MVLKQHSSFENYVVFFFVKATWIFRPGVSDWRFSSFLPLCLSLLWPLQLQLQRSDAADDKGGGGRRPELPQHRPEVLRGAAGQQDARLAQLHPFPGDPHRYDSTSTRTETRSNQGCLLLLIFSIFKHRFSSYGEVRGLFWQPLQQHLHGHGMEGAVLQDRTAHVRWDPSLCKQEKKKQPTSLRV